jgi:hypothetical protein
MLELAKAVELVKVDSRLAATHGVADATSPDPTGE